jgi:ATP-dependent RNA helicase MSS116
VEAVKLTKNTDIIVQVAVGGNSKRFMLQKTQREGCHILVATPGRLNDLLTDEYSRISAPELTTLILDEADRLLDDGFAADIEAIIDLLPDRRKADRQTLLFSATIPREVMGLVRSTLKPDFSFVQTVKEGDVATHESVPQKIVTVPGLENFMPTLLELCKRETDNAARASTTGLGNPFKAIVYFSSTANVELAANIFDNLKGEGGDMFSRHPLYPAEVFEMHGKLTQMERTRTSERFRRSKSAILFSSDVTARGMDFPGVTHVIQIGLPPNRDQYIHRIGRTGRAGRVGEGWIFITKGDLPEARSRLRGLPISPDRTLEAAQLDMTRDAQLPASLAKTLGQVGEATKMVSRGTKVKAYLAGLGQLRGNSRIGAGELNQWTRFGWGWEQPPAVDAKLAQKLGLARVEGMNIGRESRGRDDDDFGGSGRGRFGDDKPGFGAERSGGFGEHGGFRERGGRDGGRGGRGGIFGGGDRRSRGSGRSDYGGRGNGGGGSREPLASF